MDILAPSATSNSGTPSDSGMQGPEAVPVCVPRYRSWQEALKDAVRDPGELCRLLGLPPHLASGASEPAQGFPLFVPRGYLARMRPGDVNDPLLRQVLPLAEEQTTPPGFVLDPVGDTTATRSPGMLHKYRGRVLMVTTGACAVHCRYCFRRHFPYSQGPRSPEDWAPALAEIAQDSTLREVILSGGDPLTLVDPQLAELARRLASVGHLRRLRVHTRLPLMIPERIDDALLAWLTGTRLAPWMVIHANHPRELEGDVVGALARLTAAGVVLLNQSVLLRGVNDDTETMVELCERLVDLRVVPYYLHQLDRVVGAAHFEVSRAEGLAIVRALRKRLPGYAVPRYVHEAAGAAHKLVLA